MAENNGNSSLENNGRCCGENVCIDTKKIYASCKDKDCIEDLRFYPTAEAQQILAGTQSIRGGRAEILYIAIDVEPVSFNRGYFTVDMRFYYRVILQAVNGGTHYLEAEGLCVFDKRVILFGSESNARVFRSGVSVAEASTQIERGSNLPIAVVEAVDPLLLCARIVDCTSRDYNNCGLTGVPQEIAAAFDSPPVFDDTSERRVCITLGQFSMVRLERDTQLLIPMCDYCIPENECVLGGGCSGEDPCEVFDGVQFPMDDFFPPNAIASTAESVEPTAPASSSGCACRR